MRDDITIGLVVPFATDKVPDEGPLMYPAVRFVPKGVGVRALTPAGYDAAVDGILPAAEELAGKDVDAIMVIGTSLTFYRGYDFHERLLEKLRAATGLPVSTMSAAVVEGLRVMGARRIGVATAYADEVNERLRDFLVASSFEVLALKGFGLFGFGEPGKKSEQEIIDLGSQVCEAAPEAEGLLISCGGLLTLHCAKPIEDRYAVPVVTSTQAAFWQALRLAGESGFVAGCGRMLEQSKAVAPVH
jgi:arylmalonate decarboxylase